MNADEKRITNLQRQHMKCVHFTGVQHDHCKAGVAYQDFRVEGAGRDWLPCFPESAAQCAKREMPTAEQARAAALKSIEASNRMIEPIVAAHADAKARGLKKGHGGEGECKCPNCESGVLRYTVASVNGHLWAKCTTEGCAAWIE